MMMGWQRLSDPVSTSHRLAVQWSCHAISASSAFPSPLVLHSLDFDSLFAWGQRGKPAVLWMPSETRIMATVADKVSWLFPDFQQHALQLPCG